ncbi:hypothetical protein Hgul01_02394 [Herpetosiphon gulosus]|uniref:Uncharacterized protein n=1 Tax=Herpetosiphon gulosus TaxID=1973496 RepID=A0ABP9WZG1_9CHLR
MGVIYVEFIDFMDLLPSVPPLEGNAGCFHPPAPPKVQFMDTKRSDDIFKIRILV